MCEIWKPIKGFSHYEVSNKGRIRSKKFDNAHKGTILKFSICGSGYYKATLCEDKKHYQIMIHKIVAQTFIPNPENKRTVNHIDGNKLNNNVENLEWSTYSENLKHAYKNGLNYWTPKKGRDYIPVSQIDYLTGEKVAEYFSIAEASRQTKTQSSSIRDCVAHSINIANNYVWIKANEIYIDTVKKFVDEMTCISDTNLTGDVFYKEYIKYCENNNLHPFPKRLFYKILKSRDIMKNHGTIDGKSVYNVIYKRNVVGV